MDAYLTKRCVKIELMNWIKRMFKLWRWCILWSILFSWRSTLLKKLLSVYRSFRHNTDVLRTWDIQRHLVTPFKDLRIPSLTPSLDSITLDIIRKFLGRWETTQKLTKLWLLVQSWRKLSSTNLINRSMEINDSKYLATKIFPFICLYIVLCLWLIYLLAWMRKFNILKWLNKLLLEIDNEYRNFFIKFKLMKFFSWLK